MKCRQCEDILLNYDYEEIPEKIKKEIEAHLSRCIRCAEIWENQQIFTKAIQALPEIPVKEDQISTLHAKIMNGIHREMFRESTQHNRFHIPSGTFRYIAVAAATLVLGIILGNFIGGPDGTGYIDTPLASANFDELLKNQSLTDIRIEQVDPTSGKLVISAARKDNLTLTGNISDPEIQKVLAYALMSDQNPGTRLRSVKLMEGVTSSDAVQQALISSVLNDENQGVRQRALRALAQYPINDDLRNTYLNVISNDPSPALRIEAIQILMQDEDPRTRTAVLNASEEEKNETIQDIVKRFYQEPGQSLEK